jgi:hypothetical protein
MGNVDQHALGRNFLAAHLFFQWIKQLVDLHRKGASFGLAFTFAGGLDAQLRKLVAADGVGQDDLDHGLAQGAVGDRQLNVHLGLATEPGDTQAKGAPVNPDSLA